MPDAGTLASWTTVMMFFIVVIGYLSRIIWQHGDMKKELGGITRSFSRDMDKLGDSFQSFAAKTETIHRETFQKLDKHGDKLGEHDGRIRSIEDRLPRRSNQ